MKNVLLLLIAALAACDKPAPAPPSTQTASQTAAVVAPEPPKTWQVVDSTTLTPSQNEQLAKAQDAQKTLGTQLVQTLMTTANQDGYPKAVEFCNVQAPVIAAEVAAAKGVKIGRTSDKLRNVKNTAPEWFANLEKSDSVAVLTGPKGELGWVAPIKTAQVCLNCHGTTERVAPDVASVIAEKYPEDKAMGYEEGDLRGWFWVEVPAS